MDLVDLHKTIDRRELDTAAPISRYLYRGCGRPLDLDCGMVRQNRMWRFAVRVSPGRLALPITSFNGSERFAGAFRDQQGCRPAFATARSAARHLRRYNDVLAGELDRRVTTPALRTHRTRPTSCPPRRRDPGIGVERPPRIRPADPHR